MYIGSTGPSGLHHLVYEVVDNSIDEALAGFCKNVDVTIHIDGSVTVVDDGRGIPVDMHESGRSGRRSRADGAPRRRQVRELRLQSLRRPARRRRVGRQRAVGMARARDLAQRPGAPAALRARHADAATSTSPAPPRSAAPRSRSSRTRTVFETTEFSFETLSQRLRELAFLNAGVTITIDDERDGKHHQFLYEGGIREFVEFLNKNRTAVNEKPIYMTGERDGIIVEIALQWNDSYTETTYTFANNINTTEGGTHLSGLPRGADAHDQQLRDARTTSRRSSARASAATTSARA